MADKLPPGATKPLAGGVPEVGNAPGGLVPQTTGEQLQRTKGALDSEQDKNKDGSLKIHIKLDIDVEVHLTARIKGDITIGLL